MKMRGTWVETETVTGYRKILYLIQNILDKFVALDLIEMKYGFRETPKIVLPSENMDKFQKLSTQF